MQPYYQDELVTLYHGDCREVDAWMTADVLVTDPPYGIAWPAGRLHSEREKRQAAVQSIKGDEDTQVRDDVLALWGTDRPAVVFGSWRMPRPPKVRHRLIWHKKGRHPGVSPAPFFPVDEEIYLIGGGWVGKPSPTVIPTEEQRHMQPRLIGHPTPKPIPLMEHLISKCPEGSIADPFAGSGATLIAASNLGRQVIGVELEERYCELIAKRISQPVLV